MFLGGTDHHLFQLLLLLSILALRLTGTSWPKFHCCRSYFFYYCRQPITDDGDDDGGDGDGEKDGVVMNKCAMHGK